jgi:bifunctional non-homologous end joining protein LigD
MLATPGRLPVGPAWSYEVKWDGMRLLAEVTTDPAGERRQWLSSRTGRDVTRHFPELAGLAGGLPDVLLDGEVVSLVDGAPSFAALADRFHRVPTPAEVAARPVVFMVFDVLRLYGVSLVDRPWSERRATLERLGPLDDGDGGAGAGRARLSPVYDDGPALLAATGEHGLEGVVAKRRDSPYRPGRRSPSWVKVPHRHTEDCLVGGWRPERGHPSRIGGLLLGVPGEDGLLRFAGRVGSGVGGDATQRALREWLTPAEASPFGEALPREDAVEARWCEPTLTVEVSHTGWTDGHRLRQPVLARLRTDS